MTTKIRKCSAVAGFICACAAIAMAPAPAAAQATETVLHSFGNQAPKGGGPQTALIRDEAGNLYGTAAGGGRYGAGVLFKVDTTGRETVLHSFTGDAYGAGPSNLIRDSAGNLYGTTQSGGVRGCYGSCGVLFKLDPAGQYSVLYSFTDQAAGGIPSGVILDSVGNLYGTASYEATVPYACPICGMVYKLDPAGQLTVLYSFTGGAGVGFPSSGLIRDSAGNLYGTSQLGGQVYKLDTAGKMTVLYSLTGCPCSDLIRDSAGNLYGTTSAGGAAKAGVVYKLDPTGHETSLYTFTGLDGKSPSGVIRDSAGNLYGTTQFGGSSNQGVVYKLDTADREAVLYSFTGGADGSGPYAGVIGDGAGNLYGTTSFGGKGLGGGELAGLGVVYKLDAAGQEEVLYSFPNGTDGANPLAGVTGDAAGNLYGTTIYGGSDLAGVVYKLDAQGRETVLYSFTGGADGNQPESNVIVDSAGNLYGTTHLGGAAGFGVVYKLDPSGLQTVLHSFTGGADGAYPASGVIRDQAGNLYGTTQFGGIVTTTCPSGCGVIYEISASGQETTLYSFTVGDVFLAPSGLIRDSAGNLYGTYGSSSGFGVVYKLDTAGRETVLYNFTGGSDGGNPTTGVIRDSAGNLYGGNAGPKNALDSLLYKLDTAGKLTVLHTFRGGASGGGTSAVILDAAGNLYGSAGATTLSSGLVYKLDAAGQYSVIYTFPGGADGSGPSAVIRDPAGNFYGTTYSGGRAGNGTIFKIKP